jgi:hypothetical protein
LESKKKIHLLTVCEYEINFIAFRRILLLDFIHGPMFFLLKTTFRKLALLPSSGKKGWWEGWHLLCGGPLERASLNHWTLKGFDDGVMHFEESCFWTLSIFQCFFILKTTFRKLALFPSSGKKGGKGWHVLCGVP